MSRPKSSKTRFRNVLKIFPFSASVVMRSMGIGHNHRSMFLKFYKPDYSRGRVRRYAKSPERLDICGIHVPGLLHEITISELFSSGNNLWLFIGSHDECRKKLTEFFIAASFLKRGKELDWFKTKVKA